MRGMASAKEFFSAGPPGRYPIEIKTAEAGFTQTKGESQIKVSGEVSDGPEKGSVFFHNIGTDGGGKFGGMGKKHLRALGIPVDTDMEIPDALIASKLVGLRLQAELGNKQRMKPIAEGSKELTPVVEMDPKTQKPIALMDFEVIGYITQPGFKLDLGFGSAQQQQPQGQPQFQQTQQPQQQFIPQQQVAQPQLQQQFVPQQMIPQLQQPVVYPTNVAPQTQTAMPAFVPPNPGVVPTVVQPSWATPPAPGVPQGAPVGLPPGVSAPVARAS